VTIGRAIDGYSVYLLDENLQPVADGQAGELCIGGLGVARGYLNRPELEQAKFVVKSGLAEGPQRLYRSGDLTRRLRLRTLSVRLRITPHHLRKRRRHPARHARITRRHIKTARRQPKLLMRPQPRWIRRQPPTPRHHRHRHHQKQPRPNTITPPLRPPRCRP
jgi:acyl-CoA synthetase (AMP-forming)/AMP-acid ligase II